MRRYALMLLVCLLAILVPLGSALGQDPSPTPGSGLSDFLIPTSIPESGDNGGGLGGFSIPTSTPGSSSGAGESVTLPDLGDDQLRDLNLQETEVPQGFSDNRGINYYVMTETIDEIRASSPELADQLAQIAAQYGWEHSVGVTYADCQETVPISEVYSEVGQLSSPELARAFFDDPAVISFFENVGYQVTPSTRLHGWQTVLMVPEGECFAEEIVYGANFDYWGLFITVSITADAATDPNLVYNLINQLIPVLVTHIDLLAGEPFPPTPVPAGAVIEPALEPTPKSTQEVVVPPENVATLQNLERLMPAIEELGLGSPFALNTELSRARTADEYVAFWQGMGLADMANAISSAAGVDKLIGNVIYVWDTGDECPDFPGVSVEISLALFESEPGAIGYLYDPAILRELGNLGITIERRNGGIFSTIVTPHTCGSVVTYSQAAQYGRILVTSTVIAYPQASAEEILTILDSLNAYMVQKIDGAGLE